MIKKHPLLFFLLFAFPLSWYPWIIAVIHGKQSGPNPLGPLVAAILVAALGGGWKTTKALLSRIVRWRVNIVWYAVVLMLPVLTVLLAAMINVWVAGASISNQSSLPGWREVVDRFIFIFLFIGLGEETGWRGFALEELQKNRTAVQSSWILMPIWAIWHLPLFGKVTKLRSHT
jgi:membrane protease YdiL (CAAX protease family)